MKQPPWTQEELNALTVAELRNLCGEHKLKKAGRKQQVIDRLLRVEVSWGVLVRSTVVLQVIFRYSIAQLPTLYKLHCT